MDTPTLELLAHFQEQIRQGVAIATYAEAGQKIRLRIDEEYVPDELLLALFQWMNVYHAERHSPEKTVEGSVVAVHERKLLGDGHTNS